MGFKFDRLSVLVVEDTVPMRKLMTSVLEAMGVGTIYWSGDGGHGFKVFSEQNPDIVITDWHMEPVNGLDLIEKIRNDHRSPNRTVPIIMMTGYSALPRIAMARDKGATEFLVKPFSASDLAKRIAHVISKPRNFVDSNDFYGPDRRRKAREDYKGPKRRENEK